ncbi:thioredoxin-like domain-containing protein [Spongiimicrobium salis]|uniref:thioredoxin-like domain-containing protein n=1 Tax=Spongiimicrobium salis TaxID=1667022 RepID=UPI00374D1479
MKFLPTTLSLIMGILIGFSQNTASSKSTFQLVGTSTTDFSGYVYLHYGNRIDSTLVKNKSFSFKGQVNYPTESFLSLKTRGSASNPFYIEKGQMTMTVAATDKYIRIQAIEGNKTALVMNDLQLYFQKIEDDDDFVAKLYKKLDTIITENPKNQFSGMVLSDIILDPIFSHQQALRLFNKLDLPSQKEEYIESLKTSLSKLKKLKIGTTLKDFELPNKEGIVKNTKAFKKSLMLIEFWASWCAPCRKSNPELVKIYNTYATRGFEIFGVSLDTKRTAWIKAMDKDQLNWTNTFAENGFENKVIQRLGIQHLPSNFLVNADGKIVAINIKPLELEKILAESLKR